jgi:hypothetical protein
MARTSLYENVKLIPQSPSIRLVRLRADQSLSLELSSHHLEPCPEYTALSYMWGDPDKTRKIIINGVEVAVTENLWLFLAEAKRQNDRRSFWIDALSINQDDVDEKTSQVRMMGEIYKKVRLMIDPTYKHEEII